MGARNIGRLWTAFLTDSSAIGLTTSQTMTVRPIADDTGQFAFGDGTTDMDVLFYVGAATDLARFNVGLGKLMIDNMEVNFGDSDELEFGDATNGDVTMAWDGTDFDVMPAADDSIFNFGNGTLSFDLNIYGNIPTSFVTWDASADVLRLRGPVRPEGFHVNLGRRLELRKTFLGSCKPGINADLADFTTAAGVVADKDFEILGVNSTSALSTHAVGGGLQLLTAGADGDEMILVPHLDTNQTPWEITLWPTGSEVHWECHIATNANVTNQIIWAGLKLTNVEPVSTDNDAVWFRYEDDVASGSWQAAASIATVDTVTNTVAAVAVNTEYHLKIVIASDRTAQMYVNGALIRTTAALTSANLKPYIGVAADGATAAKRIVVFGQSISRLMTFAA